MNYIKALDPVKVELVVGGKLETFYRCDLKEHYELRVINDKSRSEKAEERLAAYFEYISVAAPNIEINSIDLLEFPALLDALIKLNDRIELLPWQTTKNTEAKEIKTNIEHEYRELTLIVHMIARAYGWPQEEILKLQPEVAACYVQEIMLNEWKDDEYLWRLSEVAYDEKGKYKDYPKPAWYQEIIGPSEQEAKTMVNRKFVPDGVIIDPEKERAERVKQKLENSKSKSNDNAIQG